MKRGEWHVVARWLREQHPDWTNKQIADAAGVTSSAVSKLFNPERRREYNQRDNARPGRQAQKNAWDREHQHKPCPYCPGERARGSTECMACFLATADVRRTLAEGMWTDGWSGVEITQALGVGKHYLGVRRLRDGWDLPYRYKNTKHQRGAHVAA